jgi:cysteine-rich repeat protein
MPLDRALSPAEFYRYESESSHTGLERVDHSALFLYRDVRDGSLSLFSHHGIDEDSSGITLDHGLVDMDLEGLPPGTTVLLADEGDELYFVGDGRAEGRWEFWRNTDGGVLGPLPFPGSWEIHVTIALGEGIHSWSYYDSDAAEITLRPRQEAILRAYDTPSDCRTDCTIPRCGDGRLDAGEVCDDGNVTSGDGCSADCRTL